MTVVLLAIGGVLLLDIIRLWRTTQILGAIVDCKTTLRKFYHILERETENSGSYSWLEQSESERERAKQARDAIARFNTGVANILNYDAGSGAEGHGT